MVRKTATDLDYRFKRPSDSCERGEPRLHRHTWVEYLQPSSEVGEQQKELISNTVLVGRFGTPMRSPRPWSLASDESRE